MMMAFEGKILIFVRSASWLAISSRMSSGRKMLNEREERRRRKRSSQASQS